MIEECTAIEKPNEVEKTDNGYILRRNISISEHVTDTDMNEYWEWQECYIETELTEEEVREKIDEFFAEAESEDGQNGI